jgi:hypothetical protein
MNYLIMFVGGLLGIFLHSLVKIRAINKRLPSENYKSVFVEYWKFEWASIILSVIAVLTAMFISSEYLNIKETDKSPAGIYELLQYRVAQFLKTTFVVLGFCAQAAVNAFLGVTEKKLQQKAKDGGVDS